MWMTCVPSLMASLICRNSCLSVTPVTTAFPSLLRYITCCSILPFMDELTARLAHEVLSIYDVYVALPRLIPVLWRLAAACWAWRVCPARVSLRWPSA